MLQKRPFKPQKDGTFTIGLGEHEREVLHELAEQLAGQISGGTDDGSMFRLFPPGYSEDLGRQVEYDRLMRDDLQERHLSALRVLQETVGQQAIDEMQLNAWVMALNQLRLVLGTRLDVTEETTEDDIAEDSPAAGAFALYGYLGYLQDAAVEGLSSRI